VNYRLVFADAVVATLDPYRILPAFQALFEAKIANESLSTEGGCSRPNSNVSDF